MEAQFQDSGLQSKKLQESSLAFKSEIPSFFWIFSNKILYHNFIEIRYKNQFMATFLYTPPYTTLNMFQYIIKYGFN